MNKKFYKIYVSFADINIDTGFYWVRKSKYAASLIKNKTKTTTNTNDNEQNAKLSYQ